MVDIVSVTGRIVVIKIDPGRLFAKPDHHAVVAILAIRMSPVRQILAWSYVVALDHCYTSPSKVTADI